MAPYPRTTSLPSRSGPYTASTSCGHPCGDVDLSVIDSGKFHTILAAVSRLRRLTWQYIVRYFLPLDQIFCTCVTPSSWPAVTAQSWPHTQKRRQ